MGDQSASHRRLRFGREPGDSHDRHKPGSKQQFTSPPEPCLHPLIALALPGFRPVEPLLYPIANQIADKVALLTGPPSTARAVPAGPWHRYKDLFDLHFAIRTCPISPQLLRDALADNWNWQRLPAGLPRPYRLHAQPPNAARRPADPLEPGRRQVARGLPAAGPLPVLRRHGRRDRRLRRRGHRNPCP